MPEFGCQENQFVACRIAPRHTGFRVTAEHTGTTPERSARCKERLRTVPREVRECLRGDAFLAEKPNDDPVVVLHLLNESRKRTDLTTIILNVLLM
jgi:hypothetical protein